MSSEVYNFRKPGRLDHDLEQRLRQWLDDAAALIAGRADRQLSFALKVGVRSIQAMRPPEDLERLPAATVAYRIDFSPDEPPTLLVAPRTLALVLVAGSLGDNSAELPADRELTTVEQSVFEYLLQELFVKAFQEAWPASTPLSLTIGAAEPQPKRTRLFAAGDSLIALEFTVCGSAGEQVCCWLIPQKEFGERLHASDQRGEEKNRAGQLESLVRDLPVPISVVLGTAELPLTYLANLKPGDVVILDQRVSDPLRASVAGREKFRVWPGRVGSRQAVRVDSMYEE